MSQKLSEHKMKHDWVLDNKPGVLTKMNRWVCRGCGTGVTGYANEYPESVARISYKLEDCNEQLVRNVLHE